MDNNKNNKTHFFSGSNGNLKIHSDDLVAKRLAMLIEVNCHGAKVNEAAKKYGCKRARYFQIQNAYFKGGSEALIPKKKGPQKNSVRNDIINNQILRHRFLDPEATTAVITQKINQSGYIVSHRSVERTITEYGLQKKTSFVQPCKKRKKG